MKREAAKLIRDCMDAVEDLIEMSAGLTFDDYWNNKLIRYAVERQFITLGEALNNIRRRRPELAAGVTRVDQIIGFRNVLVHGYDIVDAQTVWDVLHNDLPLLQRELQSLMDEHKI